jgi:hypothetical protein
VWVTLGAQHTPRECYNEVVAPCVFCADANQRCERERASRDANSRARPFGRLCLPEPVRAAPTLSLRAISPLHLPPYIFKRERAMQRRALKLLSRRQHSPPWPSHHYLGRHPRCFFLIKKHTYTFINTHTHTHTNNLL